MTKPKPPRRSRDAAPSPALEDRAEILRLKADLERARRALRQKGPWAALEVLGIKGKRGKKGRSRRELERVVDLYVNLRTAPGPCRPRYARTPERLDLLLENAADCSVAQAEGRPVPELPAEAYFEPDCDVPMSDEDALRNVAAYLGNERRTAHDLLAALLKGRPDLDPKHDLPPRPR